MALSSDRRVMPFLFGAQYYRAPTPGRECWEKDFAAAREAGLTDLKFWAQWRSNNPAPGEFRFDDVDGLMDLAAKHGIRATINVIYDAMPDWVLRQHPDCLMIDSQGRPVRPRAYACRQIGGAPGPCLNHAGPRRIREEFTRAVVERYRAHPALAMWDVWCEPEQCTLMRAAKIENLLCYCPACRNGFRKWLEGKYGTLERLSDVWGQLRGAWDEVEPPIDQGCLMDMVDWRLFMLDTVTREARWRIALAKELDPDHPVYLHVVPTVAHETWGFNQITCADDFALAETCDCFGGTANGYPIHAAKIASAARGKVCYNVESHMNSGSTARHALPLTLDRLKEEFLAQIGLGIRGFLFWQFRAETLGSESPAWGLVGPGGGKLLAIESAAQFLHEIEKHAPAIAEAPATRAVAGVCISAANEIFQWCVGCLGDLRRDVEGYAEFLYWNNIPFRFVPGSGMTEEGLKDLRMLVLPAAYCMAREETDAVARWVEAGGLLIAEAHTAAYSSTRGRHEGESPGGGLAELFGIREVETLASLDRIAPRLPDGTPRAFSEEVLAVMGGKYDPELVPLYIGPKDRIACGRRRCVGLEIPDRYVAGRFLDGSPAVASRPVGKGHVIYAGTTFGSMLGPSVAGKASAMVAARTRLGPDVIASFLINEIVERIGRSAGVHVSARARVHLDELKPPGRKPMFVVIGDDRCATQTSWECDVPLHGVFSGTKLKPRGGRVILRAVAPFADLFVPAET